MITFKKVSYSEATEIELNMLQHDTRIPVSCSVAHVEYQRKYLESLYTEVQHYNYGIYVNQSIICGLFMYTKYLDDDLINFATIPGQINFPTFAPQIAEKSIKKIIDHIDHEFCVESNFSDASRVIHPIIDGSQKYNDKKILDPVSRYLLSKYLITHSYKSIINLTRNEARLWSDIRKSYKSLIRSGAKLIKYEIHSGHISSNIWNKFRILHLYESKGRSVRSSETWDYQLTQITKNKAFLVSAHDQQTGDFLGAGYFELNDFECVYSVAAYRREKFNMPISHGVIWEAVKHSKSKGCKFFDLGTYIPPSEIECYSEKEYNISKFKSGFSNDTLPLTHYMVK